MDDGYTLSQARAMLGNVDIKTLNDWMEKAGITATQGRVDKRFWYLSRAHLEALALEHGRELRDVPAHKQITISELHVMLAEQQETIHRLEAQVQELQDTTLKRNTSTTAYTPSYVPSRPMAAPLSADVHAEPPATRSRTLTAPRGQVGQIGIGRRPAARLAEDHGANSWNAARDWSWTPETLASEAAALVFIEQHLRDHPKSGLWRPQCSRPACPCHHRDVGDDARASGYATEERRSP